MNGLQRADRRAVFGNDRAAHKIVHEICVFRLFPKFFPRQQQFAVAHCFGCVAVVDPFQFQDRHILHITRFFDAAAASVEQHRFDLGKAGRLIRIRIDPDFPFDALRRRDLA